MLALGLHPTSACLTLRLDRISNEGADARPLFGIFAIINLTRCRTDPYPMKAGIALDIASDFTAKYHIHSCSISSPALGWKVESYHVIGRLAQGVDAVEPSGLDPTWIPPGSCKLESKSASSCPGINHFTSKGL
jgi:hypothetical protein